MKYLIPLITNEKNALKPYNNILEKLYSLDEERLGTRALEYDRKARRGLV